LCRRVLLVEVGEDLPDHHGVLDAGDDPDYPTADLARLDIGV
jgi:hypothetical protein